MQCETKPEDIQEDCYKYPDHWFINREEGDGLHYYGGLDLALRELGELKGKRVLDAGCGDGKVSSELVNRGCELFILKGCVCTSYCFCPPVGPGGKCRGMRLEKPGFSGFSFRLNSPHWCP
jgi:hypothetical protein